MALATARLLTPKRIVQAAPRTLDFSFGRNSLAYTADGKVVPLNVPRFEPGRFGQAVLVEEGTTNICNPSYIYKDTWTVIDYGWRRITTISCSAGAVFSISADVRNPSSGNTRWAYIGFRDSGGALLAYYHALIDTSKTRQQYTTPAAPANTASVTIYWVSSTTGRTYEGKNFQIEYKPYATSFTDGTRSPETLAIPTAGVLNPQEGTVELVIIPQNNYSGTAQIHFEANAGTTNKSQVYIFNEGGYWRCGLFDKNGTLRKIDVPYDGQQGVPTRIALTWKNCNSGQANAEVKLYKNGVLQGIVSGVQIDMESAFTVCSIGRRALSAALWGNALYDDLRISSRARTDEEITAVYQSGLPLAVDEWTTYKLDFDF